ncbi:MAG TPA: TfoX/Sxy family protein [Povalibacter sp.]|nr:TfoX/Sxy family protein [Povalibacter sp.]
MTAMTVSADYLAYVIDQLAPFAKVTSRRMFGGAGLYADGLFFALLAEEELYFKVDDSNREDYVARGHRPFRPFPDKPEMSSMNYYQVPAEVLEDPDELKQWARKALAVAAAAAAAKSKPKRTAKRASRK